MTLVPETMSSHGIRLVQFQPSPAYVRTLLDAMASGDVRVEVTTLPFADVVEAHRRMDTKHSRGKLVLDHSDNPHLVPFSIGA